MADALNLFEDSRVIALEQVGTHKLLKDVTINTLKFHLTGSLFRCCERRGKWLLLNFQAPEPQGSKFTLCIHNSMHGHLFLTVGEPVEHKHDRLVFIFEKLIWTEEKVYMSYRDMRCWGQIRFFPEEEGEPKFLRDLGRDGLNERLNGDEVAEIYAQYPHGSIGDLLLRQDLIAGIGNIYRSEILYHARINPFRLVADISQNEWMILAGEIYNVLRVAHTLGGSSVSDFEGPFGEGGRAQEGHQVYGRANKPCRLCNDVLVQVELLTKRKVFFCQTCQP